MVVGGGIGGIQAALDLAASGFYVYLVEKSSAIGGKMSQLDKTFPTNDCAMCIIGPKLVECGRHINIELLTLSEVKSISGQDGNFEVKITQFPRYVDISKCIACGLCAEKCPKKVDNEYDAGLGKRKAIYLKYPQAIPLKYAIDDKSCIYFKKGKCRACEKFCPAGAVNFEDSARELTINVGSIILSTGFTPFDPASHDVYGYNRHPNIVTSLEFERILSASGPSGGRLIRPLDNKEPEKIAWLQCVGSRDMHTGTNSYCSSVCCTYAVKQALVAKEHSHQLVDTAIFYIDMRTYGKDFEKYYNRAKDEMGVRFIKSRVTDIPPVGKTGNLLVRYTDELGRRVKEDFDMVVLSIGLGIPQSSIDLAERIGIELDSHNFASTSSFEPIKTSRPGFYVCGALEAPKDIPETVAQASAAAAGATSALGEVRGTRINIKEYLPERNVSTEPIRIGVFVCHCGINIGGVANVPEIVEYANTLPCVDYAEGNLFSCSEDTQKRMKDIIIERQLNRLVVASCSPRTHAPLFRETCREAGINPYLFEMANIRDQCTWVHMHEPDQATAKCKDLVRMAVAGATMLEQVYEISQPVCQEGLVVGGGIAGMTAALGLAEQGFKTHLIEKENKLGGHALILHTTWRGEKVQPYVEWLVKKVSEHPLISVHLQTEIKDVSGAVGNFVSRLVDSQGKEREVRHGTAIIASGGDKYKPKEYLYGEDPNILLSLELDQEVMHNPDRLRDVNTAVFIQCVGSREPERPYCSRVCCTHSIHSALTLKELNPDMDIYILYRDVRTYGEREDIYREARAKGVGFICYDLHDKPSVEKIDGGKLRVTVKDQTIEMSVQIDADIITLASAIVARADNDGLSRAFKVAMNQDGFFMEAHAKLKPVDFASPGIFFCGLAHGPKAIDETISQAKAAVSRACTILAHKEQMVSGAVAVVDPDLCGMCLTCVRTCPYHVPFINRDGVAQIDVDKCHGCGMCAAECPYQAITLAGLTTGQIMAKIDACIG